MAVLAGGEQGAAWFTAARPSGYRVKTGGRLPMRREERLYEAGCLQVSALTRRRLFWSETQIPRVRL